MHVCGSHAYEKKSINMINDMPDLAAELETKIQNPFKEDQCMRVLISILSMIIQHVTNGGQDELSTRSQIH